MTLQRGHTINVGRKHNRGPVGATKRALRSLAIALREDTRLEDVVDNMFTLALGKDPLSGERIEPKDRIAATKMILERAFGQPAQHVVLEGTSGRK